MVVSEANNTRIIWIDYAKVICIISMVLCHAGLTGIAAQVIYQFHMPALFIISGLLYKNRGVIKELRSFFIPVVFLSVFNWLVRMSLSIVSQGVAIGGWGGVICEFTQKCIKPLYYVNDGSYTTLFTGLWFLVSLLVVKLLLQIPLVFRFRMVFAFICLVFTSIQPYILCDSNVGNYYIFHSISAFPFVVIGINFKKSIQQILNAKLKTIIICLLLFITLTYINGKPDMIRHNYGINYILFFLNALIGSFLLFKCCSLFRYNKVIEALSTGTLFILGVHMIVVCFVDIANHLFFHCSATQFLSIVSTILVIALCYYPILWFKDKMPVLLGK